MQSTEERFEDDWPKGRSSFDSVFRVDVAGYEGPLDVLLTLARQQKVDLAQISMVALADQYLEFVAGTRDVRLDLAADYLVMAAWLAYLKSRLLLPRAQEGEPSPELMAEALQFHLRRLEAIRGSVRQLMAGPQVGRDVYRCGNPEGLPVDVVFEWRESLWRLFTAYGDLSRRTHKQDWRPEVVDVYSVEEALRRIETLVGNLPDWKEMFSLLPESVRSGIYYRSVISSTLVASLELARQGKVELRQAGAFAAVEMRKRRE